MTKERLSKLQKELLKDILVLQKEKLYGVVEIRPVLALMPLLKNFKKVKSYYGLYAILHIKLSINKRDYNGKAIFGKNDLTNRKAYQTNLKKVNNSLKNLQDKKYIKLIDGRFPMKIKILPKAQKFLL